MPIFETSTNDPLGLWASTPRPEMVSFGMGDETDAPQPEVPVYRVNLPAGSAAPSATLQSSERYIAQINAALESVPDRLDILVARMQAQQPQVGTAVSFDVTTLEPEPGPEGDLLALLSDIDQGGARVTAEGEVSFGLGEITSVPVPGTGALGAAKEQFNILLEQVSREVTNFAWVETSVADQLLARTVVNWDGDAQTFWYDGIAQEQIVLHKRTLGITTQTRNLKLRLFVTAAGGASKVAALLATPGGAVLALPAVFQYVMKIVAQVKELQSIG